MSSASKYGVETKTIAADFSSLDIYSNIEDRLKGLEIGILGEYVVDDVLDVLHRVKVRVRNIKGSSDGEFNSLCKAHPGFPSSLPPSVD